MNNQSITYQLPTLTGVMSHSWFNVALLRDAAMPQEKTSYALDARVQSGDYFVTLATTLDELGKNASDHDVRLALEDAVSELIYLQDNYSITKNTR